MAVLVAVRVLGAAAARVAEWPMEPEGLAAAVVFVTETTGMHPLGRPGAWGLTVAAAVVVAAAAAAMMVRIRRELVAVVAAQVAAVSRSRRSVAAAVAGALAPSSWMGRWWYAMPSLCSAQVVMVDPAVSVAAVSREAWVVQAAVVTEPATVAWAVAVVMVAMAAAAAVVPAARRTGFSRTILPSRSLEL
jgi:hypothetical protein